MKAQRRVGILIPVLIAIAAGTWFMVGPRRDGDVLRASGTVEATEADLGFQMPGRIATIAVREGDHVDTGDQLATLDRGELAAQLAAARARATAARATLTELRTGSRQEEIDQGRAAARAAAQRMNEANRNLERTRRLFEGGAVSQEQLDHDATAFDIAEADHDQAAETLRMLEAGPRPERIAAQQAAFDQAQANVAQIRAALTHSIVVAPFSGIVTNKHRELGEIVTAGSPILTIMDPDDRWIRIYVRADAVGRLSIGEPVAITADAYTDRTYEGEVTYIASEAEFTPRNVQTTEERVKLVYEVRVRILTDPSFDLKPGLAADVVLGRAPMS